MKFFTRFLKQILRPAFGLLENDTRIRFPRLAQIPIRAGSPKREWMNHDA